MTKSINKEGLLNFYIFKNRKVLEDIFNVTILNMQMETNIGLEKIRKVDIYAKTNSELILGEVQLSTADNIHLTQVLNNINSVNRQEQAIIFWIAKDFKQYHINEIKEVIKGKNIIFYALKLSVYMDETLSLLGKLGESEATLNIDIVSSIPTLFTIDSCFVSNNSSFFSNNYYMKSNTNYSKLSDKENMLNYIHSQIKKEITDNYKLNFTKNFENNFLYIGAGQADVSFRIACNKRENLINIDLIFCGNKKEKFYNLLETKSKIIEDLDNKIEFSIKGSKINYCKQINMQCLEMDLENIAKQFCIMYRYFKLYI